MRNILNHTQNYFCRQQWVGFEVLIEMALRGYEEFIFKTPLRPYLLKWTFLLKFVEIDQ